MEEYRELNVFVKLFKSRKFLTLVLDIVVSSLIFFIAKYNSPEALETVKFLILTYQPAVLFVINAWAQEDVAAINSGV